MTKRRQQRRREREVPELNITTFLNLMVVLVPFLLISAVFSRVTILELSVPTAAAESAVADKPNFTIEVIVRKEKLEFANGARVISTIPNQDGQYDLEELNELLIGLKAKYPEKEDATVLMEPQIEYDHLIQVMDTIRGAANREDGAEQASYVALFPNISIGDAP